MTSETPMLDTPPEEMLFDLHAEVCQALADPKRLRIIAILRRGEMTVSALAGALGLPQANVSHHLAILRRLGLVVPRREGAQVFYSIANPKVVQACELMREVLLETIESRGSLVRAVRR